MKCSVLGKSEGKGADWHGHVSALSVSPLSRRLGIAGHLMRRLESASEEGMMNFVDLFVRVSNRKAIEMYGRMGYTVYRRILGYYSEPDEDAFGTKWDVVMTCNAKICVDMRKALSRDVDATSMIPLKEPVHWKDLKPW